MKNIMRTRLLWGAVLVLGLVALFIPWVSQFRILSPESVPAAEISVTSEADGGLGSLREAIFAAAKNPGKTQIKIKVNKIILKTPLPPLVNAQGIDIDTEESHAAIDAKLLPEGPVLDVATPSAHILGLQINNASGQAILLRESGARIKGVVISNSKEGIYLVDGVQDVVIEQSRFEGNITGIHLQPAVSRVTVKDNTFLHQRKASIWAVSPKPQDMDKHINLVVRGNRFTRDFQSIVLIHAQGKIMNNSFEGMEEAAVYLVGSGSMAKNNRLSNGLRFGFSIDSSSGMVIEENEIDHNAGGGILLKSSSGVNIKRNRLYDNGYGMAVLFGSRANPNTIADNLLLQQKQDGLYVVGESPILRSNVVRQSGKAGIRLLTYKKTKGELLTPNPLLEKNDLTENADGNIAQGIYSEETVPVTPANPSPGSAISPGTLLSGSTAGLSWGAVSGATYYSLGVRDIASSTLVVNATTTDTRYTAALTAGKQYRWSVAACNATRCSSYTTVLFFQTPAAVTIP